MGKKEKPSPLAALDYTRWMQSLGVLLLTAGACSIVWELAALHAQSAFFTDELRPEIFTLAAPASVANSTEWRAIDGSANAEVSSDDLLHLSYLEAACQVENDTVLPWVFAAPDNAADRSFPNPQTSTSLLHRGDPRLLDELRQCPDVDIYLPSDARGPAGCGAVVGQLKYLRSRLLPDWALEAQVYDIGMREKTNYYELCPQTPMLFLSPDHLLKLVNSAAWPKSKPVYLMAPTVDFNTKPVPHAVNFTRSVLELTDVVLCRTMRCDQDIKQFLMRRATEKSAEEESSAVKNTRVLYTSQISPDPVNFARRMRNDEPVQTNLADYAYTRFAHTTWNVSSKTTQDVFSCWTNHRTELPPLDVYLLRALHDNIQNDGSRMYKPFPGNNETKVQIVDPINFSKQFGDASFFICPTAEDDCLDLARAAGGVIVTADAYPMNEFVSGPHEGVVFPTQQSVSQPQAEHRSLVPDDALLLPPPPANYRSSDLCSAVLKVRSSMNLNDRKNIGLQTRSRFHEDAKYFMLSMLELQGFTHHMQSLREQMQSEEELQVHLRHRN
ncbi:NPP1 protein [Phytophthora cinnamomi]|uniref:NPP1 protein n=1 Tax=Phytophthora cinnamomi TaxID=4785 RepID=UPI00355A5041|nr:NPP1 protein [Phytophthora cinnamomi]